MKADFRDTFLLALERGLLPEPVTGQKWLVFNGHALPQDALAECEVLFEQGFRPAFLDIQRRSVSVVPAFNEVEHCDHAVVFASRVRAVNEANFARAWQATRTGGSIIVAGDKASGIASLRKWVGQQTEVVESFSKHHAVCFWCERQGDDGLFAEITLAKPLFSSGEPDAGSTLLASQFNDRIFGKVADFGAGDGFLTRQLLQASSKVTSVDLMEAEWAALELAKADLSQSAVPLSFHWIDVTSELQKKPLDWVIMNPPFHHGLHGSGKPDPDLGRSFIAHAASTLVKGGRLLMVANRKLAYEATLEKLFRKTIVLEEANGFKVLEATR